MIRFQTCLTCGKCHEHDCILDFDVPFFDVCFTIINLMICVYVIASLKTYKYFFYPSDGGP